MAKIHVGNSGASCGMTRYAFIAGNNGIAIEVGLCFIFHGMDWGMSWMGFPANRILYAFCSVVGTMLFHQGLDGIAKYYNHKVGEDRFNFENESFEQSEKMVDTPYSVNIPMLYYWKRRLHNGYINIGNPFRGTSRGKEAEPKQTVLDSKVNVTGMFGNNFGQLIQSCPKYYPIKI